MPMFWFFGDFSGTVSRIPRMQGTRRVSGSAPLREGGGAAMNGMSMHGRRETAGAATGGVLRLAVAASATPHRERTNQEFCGWTKWTPASTATRSTPPAALSICSEGTIPLPSLPPGGTPLSEGGECLRVPHALNTAPSAPPSTQSTKIPEEPMFSIISRPPPPPRRNGMAVGRPALPRAAHGGASRPGEPDAWNAAGREVETHWGSFAEPEATLPSPPVRPRDAFVGRLRSENVPPANSPKNTSVPPSSVPSVFAAAGPDGKQRKPLGKPRPPPVTSFRR